MAVHPTAIIDHRAQIDPSAEIGPYAVVQGPVVLGPRTIVQAHAVLLGDTIIGADNVIHAGAVIGDFPQDLSFRGQKTGVRIGNKNIFREHVQVHRATKEGAFTTIGDENFLMTGAHVAHDCHVGNRVILATGATLGGHVTVGDQAFVSGNCVVHQFVRIGRLSLMRGLSRAGRDVPPFCILDETHTVRGINRIGLRRAGFSPERIRAIQRAYARLFARRCNLKLAITELEVDGQTAEVRELIEFIRSSQRGVSAGPRQRDDEGRSP